MPFDGFALTIRGASHESVGTPCQDSARVCFTGNLAAAAVSDGHGSEKHFRSSVGSDVATRIAIRSITEFCAQNGGLAGIFPKGERKAARRIAANIICSWNEEIAEHLKSFPLNAEEQKISEKYGGLPSEIIYGATLILAAADESGVFGLQIGDGCLAVIENGTALLPMPEDERLVGNLTTSLCDCDAIDSFRCFRRGGEGLGGIVLSSDGLINSFVSLDDFLSFTARTAQLRKNELPAFSEHLRERSAAGSRDDISAAVIRWSKKDTE